MHLVHILLPTADNDGRPFPRALFDALREELTERFGGVTFHSRAPAEGFWKGEEGTARDSVVIVEVMDDALDPAWWRERREGLEREFRQSEVIVRAMPVTRL